ncbi:hypothetical protein F4777DRAFT_29957 [Nemania sp. FL0916]|nr:hypothetical protein F4777DRAFT_29957 [Nemania sp. FL0916]
MANWGVSSFKVETTQPDSRVDSLFANGNMQIPVVVSIKATDNETSAPYNLSDDELDSIDLIDYDAPDSLLSEGWVYTAERDDTFYHTIGGPAGAATDAAVANTASGDDANQTKIYWVSATKVENKRVAARITQPDGKIVTTCGPEYTSYVTLTGKVPIKYTTDNTKVVREDTDNGTFKIVMELIEVEGHWDQDNYYVSSSVYDFIKAEIYGYDTTGCGQGHPADLRLTGCYAFWTPDNNMSLRLSFIWQFGPQSTQEAGLTQEDGWCAALAHPNITINQKSNALCLTRLRFNADIPLPMWKDRWANSDCGFTIYDIYGNWGKFSAGFSDDHDLIKIKNAN